MIPVRVMLYVLWLRFYGPTVTEKVRMIGTRKNEIIHVKLISKIIRNAQNVV